MNAESPPSECPQCHKGFDAYEGQLYALEFCPRCRFPLMMLAGKYRLTREVAEGGFGKVYEATHVMLPHHPKRAVKFIKPEVFEKPGMEQRFYREVRVTSMLGEASQHIIRIYDDVGEVKNLGHFYVMEFLEGETVAERLRGRGALSYDEAIPVFLQLCEAMRVTHEAGVVHRDLKPDNLYLVSRGQGVTHLKVLDFGIAKPLAWSTQAITRGAIGTPLYMSPEQCLGQEVGPAADMYAMGVLLFEFLSGVTPFGPKTEEDAVNFTPMQIIHSHVQEPVPPLSLFAPGVLFPDALQGVIEKAMSKRPEERFGSVYELELVLTQILHNTQSSSAIDLTADADSLGLSVSPSYEGYAPVAEVPSADLHFHSQETQPPYQEDDKATTPERPAFSASVLEGSTQTQAASGSRWLVISGVGFALMGLAFFLGGLWTRMPQGHLAERRATPARTQPKMRRAAPRPKGAGWRPSVPTTRKQPHLRFLPECPKAPYRWSYLMLAGRMPKKFSVRFHKGKGAQKKGLSGVCVGVSKATTQVTLEGRGIVPCTIKTWHRTDRVPIFLRKEGGLEPQQQNYCLKPGR